MLGEPTGWIPRKWIIDHFKLNSFAMLSRAARPSDLERLNLYRGAVLSRKKDNNDQTGIRRGSAGKSLKRASYAS